MKKMKYAVTLLLGLSMLIMASCTKEPKNEGGNNGNTYNGHEYVDLGLPSGTLWATCNVGATTPEECGEYFAWGETTPKSSYTWENYKYGSYYDELTKYCCDANSGYNGFTDNLTTLQAIDDAATINWGGGWHTPTQAQLEELLRFTIQQVTYQQATNGQDTWDFPVGLTLTGLSQNNIYFPFRDLNYLGVYPDGIAAAYWTNTLAGYSDDSAVTLDLGFDIEHDEMMGRINGQDRKRGLYIRPVCEPINNRVVSNAIK